jgi:hypothetical protein
MNCCAWLLLYTLLLSCSDACGLKVGVSPGPAFGRITSQNNLPNGIASGIGPGPHQCSHRKTKGTPASERAFQSTTDVSVLASAGALPGAIASQKTPDAKFLSLNRWRKPSEMLLRNLKAHASMMGVCGMLGVGLALFLPALSDSGKSLVGSSGKDQFLVAQSS